MICYIHSYIEIVFVYGDFEFIHNLFILLIKVSHTVNFRTPRRITFFNFFDRDHVRFLVMRVEI